MANSINCEGNNSGLILPWPLISGFCLVKEKEEVLRYHTLGQNYFQKNIHISFSRGFTNDKHTFHRKQKCMKWDMPSEMFSDRCAHHIQWWTMFQARWVSVVEFHVQALSIGKVFGQESTVVKWNYQILSLHLGTVCQKLGVILVIKWF